MAFSVVLIRKLDVSLTNDENLHSNGCCEIELIPSIEIQKVYNIRNLDGNFGSYNPKTCIVSDFNKKAIEPLISKSKFVVNSRIKIHRITAMVFYNSFEQASKLFEQIQEKYPA